MAGCDVSGEMGKAEMGRTSMTRHTVEGGEEGEEEGGGVHGWACQGSGSGDGP